MMVSPFTGYDLIVLCCKLQVCNTCVHMCACSNNRGDGRRCWVAKVIPTFHYTRYCKTRDVGDTVSDDVQKDSLKHGVLNYQKGMSYMI